MSEQDFFFDEEPEAKVTPAKAPKAPATSPSKSAAKTSTPEPVAYAADQSTTWAVAALIGVVGLLLGAILGFVLGNTLAGSNSAAPASSSVAAPATAAGTQAAPQLTSQQISAGQLPAGHPAINASGAVVATPTK